jgi:hypothetical protein
MPGNTSLYPTFGGMMLLNLNRNINARYKEKQNDLIIVKIKNITDEQSLFYQNHPVHTGEP